MQIHPIPTSGFASNCWLLWDEHSREAAVTDPSADCAAILDALRRRNLTLQWILLTHGHFDHIFALDQLRDSLPVPAVIGEADAGMLTDSQKNASSLFFRQKHRYRPAEKTVREGDTLSLGGKEIRVIAAPGHSPGSVVYEIGDVWLTGDVLFDGSIGRTDLPGGDSGEMMLTLRRLCGASEKTLYPGHGPATTLSLQKQINPFLREF